MTGFLWAAFGSVGTFVIMATLGDMVSEEVRDRLDHLPHAILRLAARRLDQAQRVTIYEEEWLAELTYILKGDEARPVTRLVKGAHFALGILARARLIGGHLHREVPIPAQVSQTGGDGVLFKMKRVSGTTAGRAAAKDLFALTIERELRRGRAERDPGQPAPPYYFDGDSGPL